MTPARRTGGRIDEVLQIDRYAYLNRLRGLHPAEKALLAGTALLVSLAGPPPLVPLLVLAVMAGATVGWAGIPWRYYLGLLAAGSGFLILGLPAVALKVAPGGAGLLWGLRLRAFSVGLDAAGMEQAVHLLARCLGAVSGLYFLALTTPAAEVLGLLRRLGVPDLLVELMGLTYRYLFVLLETAHAVYVSQAARGGYASWRRAFRSLGLLVSVLFVRAHHRALVLFTALSARGYGGSLEVVGPERHSSWKGRLAVGCLTLALMASWVLAGGGAHVRAHP
ncbi:MAG: cobalt ECF transporter T component CbiQ [Firmicutes bacterium]|nr:cobalt ECF transporter T component CbiQ [Bacillota bacterium]